MTLIVRPAASVVLGLALMLYGIFHAVTRYPGSNAFRDLALGLPVLGQVGLFVLCVLAGLAGLVLLVRNVRRFRYAWRHLQRVTGSGGSANLHYADDEPVWAGGHRG